MNGNSAMNDMRDMIKCQTCGLPHRAGLAHNCFQALLEIVAAGRAESERRVGDVRREVMSEMERLKET